MTIISSIPNEWKVEICFEMIDSPFTGISDFGVLPKFSEIF